MLNAAIISAIEDFAPAAFQESWDNTGVQVGSLRAECTGVLLCLDATPDVVDEAINRGCNLIISHHPLLFKGLKRISGNTPVEETVMRAIAAGITIYSCHTAVDSTAGGVSYRMAEMLGAKPVKVLSPLSGLLVHVSAIVTPDCADTALTAFNEAAPKAMCFRSESERYTSSVISGDPFATADISSEKCVKIEATVDASLTRRLSDVLAETLHSGLLALTTEKVADTDSTIGLGVYAIYEEELKPMELIDRVKSAFHSPVTRCSAMPDCDTAIRRIAMCGGSGSEFISTAIRMGAQAFITSDTKYHDFVDFGKDILIIDIGHFESESCTKEIFYNVIREKFPNFACYYSEIEENPIKYI
ncbi:MAG: Nif3-like dinuclear metal center hexameric protein [Muribaculaceae bacterium]|nr:Nif3-like dinuclear metal center hexameric protein [Muribaculaceae bacterium]